MYAKVFSQIFDSSIADDYPLRHFFMDMLVLADINGVVDMTPTAIAGRTRIPLEQVEKHLAVLESPDTESRTPGHEGRRIARLDKHRSWGWAIINYNKFRAIASEEQRREKTKQRVRKYRVKVKKACNAPVTHGNAGNAMQRQRQRQKEGGEGKAPPSNGIPVSERITLERSLDRVSDRLSELKEADLPFSVEERKELRVEKSRLLGLLGLKA